MANDNNNNSKREEEQHVVVVMDPLKEFCTKPVEWALRHVAMPGCMLTILGVMPWLNLAQACKKSHDIWTSHLGDLSTLKERSEWKNDPQFHKLRAILDHCGGHGVVPLMKVAMGHPVRLTVLEQVTNLHATWVILDKHQRKRRSFYRRRIPCNMVMMNGDGEAEMLRVSRPMLNMGEMNSTSEMSSVATALPPAPKVIVSKEWMEMLKKDSKKKKKKVAPRA